MSNATQNQIARAAAEWSAIAGEPVKIEAGEIGGPVYGFCSEMGALRIYKKFAGVGRVEFSENLGSWFFASKGVA